MKSFPNSFIYRLPDQLSGYLTVSQNPGDFICFTNKRLFLIECKSHDGASIPFTAIPQYERLLNYKNIPDVYPGIVINKSIQLKMFEKNLYNIIEIPSTKKRVFMDSDYTILSTLEKEKEN